MFSGEIKMQKKDLILMMVGIFVLCMAIVFFVARSTGYRDGRPMRGTTDVRASGSGAACAGCGQWGAPTCPACNSQMQFNPSYGVYACPRCQRPGMPFCANCMRPTRGSVGQNASLLPQMQPSRQFQSPVNAQNPVRQDPMMPVA
jgi:hypothetical protein